MKPAPGIFIALLTALAISCAGPPPAGEGIVKGTAGVAQTEVNFLKSSHHFVKNPYSPAANPSYFIMRNYPVFAANFGVAAVMGMDTATLITEEKMKNRFVLSIVHQGRDFRKMDIEKITLANRQLQVYYTSEVTMRDVGEVNCHVTVLVDDCGFDSVLFYENGRYLPGAAAREL